VHLTRFNGSSNAGILKRSRLYLTVECLARITRRQRIRSAQSILVSVSSAESPLVDEDKLQYRRRWLGYSLEIRGDRKVVDCGRLEQQLRRKIKQVAVALSLGHHVVREARPDAGAWELHGRVRAVWQRPEEEGTLLSVYQSSRTTTL
jgi:hypothetical protein